MEPEPEFAHEQSPQRVARQLSADHILELETEAAAAATQRVGSVPTAPGCSSGSAVAVAKQGDSAARLSADAKGPLQTLVDPQPDPSHPFRSCLDREYVQKEIRWAWKYKKKIIVLFEKDQRRAGFFDHGEAWGKYRGTEWEAILNIDAESYQRDEIYAQGMVQKILQKAQGVPAAAVAAPALNAPGSWDLFLSHAQATGGDQVQTTSLRLKGAEQEVWYDNAMLDRSTAAMEEGVKHSRCFVLFLTGDAAPQKSANTLDDAPQTPARPLNVNVKAGCTPTLVVTGCAATFAVVGSFLLLYNALQRQQHTWDQLLAGDITAVCDTSLGVCTCSSCCPGSSAGNATACNFCVTSNCSPYTLSSSDLNRLLLLFVLTPFVLRLNDFLCAMQRCREWMSNVCGRCYRRDRAASALNQSLLDQSGGSAALGRTNSTQARVQSLSEYLVSTFALGAGAAEEYAQKLAAQHIDTPAVFETLTVQELQTEFGFLRGDIIKMRLAQQPPTASTANASLAMAGRLRGGGSTDIAMSLSPGAQALWQQVDASLEQPQHKLDLLVTLASDLDSSKQQVELEAKQTDTIASIRMRAQLEAQDRRKGRHRPSPKGGYKNSPPPGFTYDNLLDDVRDWSYARRRNGDSARTALVLGTMRLLFWHLLQPLVYFYVLWLHYADFDSLQRGFGVAVGVREAGYLLTTLLCACANPAFLLVNVGTSVRSKEKYDVRFLLVYVFAPEKFVVSAFHSTCASKSDREYEDGCDAIPGYLCLAKLFLVSLCLDLCSVGALVASVRSVTVPLPLVLGYAMTAIVPLVLISGGIIVCIGKGMSWRR
jgi:hypothetical protein